MRNIDHNEQLFSIGTVARMLDVSVQTLRLYEQRGLILVKKSAGNQRLYSQADLERLRCLRHAIVEDKISLEGIRRIHSMIPCWAHVQCPMEQRLSCPAYGEHSAGCWTYKHSGNTCSTRDCTDCEIYCLSTDCNNIKLMIRDRLSGNTSNQFTAFPSTEDSSV